MTVDSGTPAEKRLTVLRTGDFFGEMAVLAGRQRIATVTALEDDTRCWN